MERDTSLAIHMAVGRPEPYEGDEGWCLVLCGDDGNRCSSRAIVTCMLCLHALACADDEAQS